MTSQDQNPKGDRVQVEAFILGAGVCGVAAAVRLQEAGLTEIVVAERANELGGTWHHNTYPGCACDIPSHIYSFSYAPNPDWSRIYSPQSEIQRYLGSVAERQHVDRFIHYGVEVLGADWNSETARWNIETTERAYEARFFVAAAGPLHEPVIPPLPGIESFKGRSFHSSEWPEDLDLTGLNVVTVGTGASAVQFVPAIAPSAGNVTVLQRTASWVFPKPDWNLSRLHKLIMRRVPGATKLMRWGLWGIMDILMTLVTGNVRIARAMRVIGRWQIGRYIKDPALRTALTPDYAIACKRLCFSNDYYRAFARPNVDLVTSPAQEIREHSVITADGQEIPADVIIYGTGFHTLQTHPVNDLIRGIDGRSLAQVWDRDPTAHMGTTVAGFPNAFVMFGPNVGTLSGFTMAEAQCEYIAGAIATADRLGVDALDVKESAQKGFVQEMDDALESSVWALGGCDSYYLGKGTSTRVSLPWPHSMSALVRRLRSFDPDSYDDVRPTQVVAEAPQAGSSAAVSTRHDAFVK